MTGAESEQRLESAGVLTSRQSIPSDASKKMSEAGGLRLGTAWITSRGYGQQDVAEIGTIIKQTLSSKTNEPERKIVDRVGELAVAARPNDVWAKDYRLVQARNNRLRDGR